MKKYAVVALVSIAVMVAWADWPSAGGGPARDGWARGETALSPATAKDIKFLYVHKFDNTDHGESGLGTPLILSRIVTWKGFKALMFVGASNDTVYAIDSEISRDFFKAPLGSKADKPQTAAATLTCPGGMTANITIPGTITAGGRGGGGGGRGASGASGGRGGGGGGGGGGRGIPRGPQPSVYAIGSDGWLRWVREQDGDIAVEPSAKFVPANSRISALAVANSVIYGATEDDCGGNPNALYAMNISLPEAGPTPLKTVASFPTNGAGFAGSAGVAIGTGGTVFGQVADGNGSTAGKYSDTVLALDGKTLAVKDYFTPAGTLAPAAKDSESAGATPALFDWNGKEIVVAGSRDGRIYLLDATSLGGSDHHTPLAQTAVISPADATGAGNGIWNSFATWSDAAHGNTRWIYASINGPSSAQFSSSNGAAPTGSVVAFTVTDQNGKPALTAQWISRDLTSPAAPVVANGLVYALSTGRSPRTAKVGGGAYTVAEHEKLAKPAIAYVFDAATGKEVFNSGNKAITYATSGIALADSQFFFASHDNNVYAFGLEAER